MKLENPKDIQNASPPFLVQDSTDHSLSSTALEHRITIQNDKRLHEIPKDRNLVLREPKEFKHVCMI